MINEKILFPIRYQLLSKSLAPYLKGNKRVLDIGSSDGKLAKEIQNKIGGEFIGIDVLIQPVTFIPIEKYDGKILPFKDDTFDCVLISDVLHHAEDQERLLNEAKRVSCKYLVIKDHYWKSKLDFLILKIADYIGNKPYNVSLPYKFLTLQNWKDIFQKNDLRVIEQKKFRFNFFDPVKQIIFKLEKK